MTLDPVVTPLLAGSPMLAGYLLVYFLKYFREGRVADITSVVSGLEAALAREQKRADDAERNEDARRRERDAARSDLYARDMHVAVLVRTLIANNIAPPPAPATLIRDTPDPTDER